ncbi:squalene-associated FAD-dependent desaturase [Paucimonas lemoignei]|uniref:Squalene-associated FAD-dependent desaturase n=1 Tax=Paucimonas lemoignei TaxID=29443 RepID=A0A4R3I0K1_PAULE|nr:hydroxysqualene dehydroxylase HpnE [Paucimonas lemoignei]TCS39226.1 squalene-associated FAD-dependent desaturase [Paucimonas lemoignei]
MKSSARKVAVIGAGWAGCAAAVEASRRGHQVTLFERARTLGGRARAVELNGMLLDNGQHILLGAYRETLRLMQTVGIKATDAFLRLPLQMRYAPDSGGMDFLAPRLPAPLHLLAALLRAKGLAREDKLALARFSSTARWMGWQLHTDCTVAELLERFDQTDRLVRLMWNPLCIAALNTPPQRASAQVFLNVLRDSLGARRAASDMLLPRVDLTSMFPQHAAAHVEKAGGSVYTGCTVNAISPAGEAAEAGWTLQTNGGGGAASTQHFDAVIIATDPGRAAELLAALPGAPPLPAFEHEPITTCYLQYDASLRLSQPFLALIDDAESGNWGQFVFDRGQLVANQAGLLAVVVSTSALAVASEQENLSAAVARQLAETLRQPELLKPHWSKVISEKRATFVCTPALTRPAIETGLSNLFLAGDYVASDYPATLESAVQSGVAAAKLIKTR